MLTLSGAASVADYPTALRQVQFGFNASVGGGGDVNPTAIRTDLSRSITWQVTDGFLRPARRTLKRRYTVTHTAPVVTAGGIATFGGGQTVLDAVTVSGVDSGNRLDRRHGHDHLRFYPWRHADDQRNDERSHHRQFKWRNRLLLLGC